MADFVSESYLHLRDCDVEKLVSCLDFFRFLRVDSVRVRFSRDYSREIFLVKIYQETGLGAQDRTYKFEFGEDSHLCFVSEL